MARQQDMAETTIIITGASGAMGSAAVKAMAREGYGIIMACRNLEKGAGVRESILREIPDARLEVLHLDLASLASVRAFADAIAGRCAEGMVLGGLFNNAGIINRYFKVTEDGYENTMATNFIGPSTLTEALLPHFVQGAHIVSMVSLTCGMTRLGQDFLTPRKEDFHQLRTYAKSKLALLLYSLSLSERVSGRVFVNLADPGIVNSNMISMGRWFDPLADVLFRPFCKSPENGVAPAVRALLADKHQRFFIGNPKPGSHRSGDRSIPMRYWRMLKDQGIRFCCSKFPQPAANRLFSLP